MTEHAYSQCSSEQSASMNSASTPPFASKNAIFSPSIEVLGSIYDEATNLAVWQSQLSEELRQEVDELLEENDRLNIVATVTPENAYQALAEHSASMASRHLVCQQIALLVDMFCTLFELKRIGLRLARLDRAMCPKFHVDRVPCRLVTTLSGVCTQWLENEHVDRTKLGAGSAGLPDDKSGIYDSPNNIQQLSVGYVALLKGESWYNNENKGLVHRSPGVAANEQRLLLTLDFID